MNRKIKKCFMIIIFRRILRNVQNRKNKLIKILKIANQK